MPEACCFPSLPPFSLSLSLSIPPTDPDKRRVTGIIIECFPYLPLKFVVGNFYDCLTEVIIIDTYNICFYVRIWKHIPKFLYRDVYLAMVIQIAKRNDSCQTEGYSELFVCAG